MFGEDPHGIHERWTEEGRRLIDESFERHFRGSERATALDAARQVLKMVAYALVPEGEDLDTLFADALEAARNDYSTLQWCMAEREKRWG